MDGFLLSPAGIATAVVLALAAGDVVACIRLRGPEDTLLLAQLRVVTWAYVRVFHRLQSSLGARDPLPPEGPVIVIANHHSGVDPFFIAVLTRRPVHFLMAREYYEIPALRWLFKGLGCIPVNRDGNDLGATKAALSLLRGGKVVGIFPQGGIREASEDLGEGKGGVALLALKTGASVVPFYIADSPSYPSVLRAFFSCSRTRVYCGHPFRLTHDGPGRPSRGELAALTAEVLRAIADQNPRAVEVAEPENVENLSKNRMPG
jgi:1-acyl-sn-glycerol-3-phosphate acyltransferase